MRLRLILASFMRQVYFTLMVTLSEIEQEALLLPEKQRALLAANLLDSLSAVCHDDDAGIAEAMRRDEELDRDPSSGMTLEEFKMAFRR